MAKVAFFDIDGTLTDTLDGSPFKKNPQDVIPFPGVVEGLNYYKKFDWILIGISNQGGVAAGKKSIDSTITEMQYTLSLLPQLSSIYFCPDYEGMNLYQVFIEGVAQTSYKVADITKRPYPSFRKPSHGMIVKALWDIEYRHHLHLAHSFQEPRKFILESCWFVGDRPEDRECAANAEINFMPAEVWRQRFTPGFQTFDEFSQIELTFLEQEINIDDIPFVRSVDSRTASFGLLDFYEIESQCPQVGISHNFKFI